MCLQLEEEEANAIDRFESKPWSKNDGPKSKKKKKKKRKAKLNQLLLEDVSKKEGNISMD